MGDWWQDGSLREGGRWRQGCTAFGEHYTAPGTVATVAEVTTVATVAAVAATVVVAAVAVAVAVVVAVAVKVTVTTQ